MDELPNDAGGHLQELRRGTVVLACLIRLRTPDYGYALLESLDRLGVSTDANTLYPLLRRLEKQGLLVSEWNTEEARPRKFYRTSPAGDAVAQVLVEDWQRLDGAIRAIAGAPRADSPGANEPRTDARPSTASDAAPDPTPAPAPEGDRP